MSPLLSKHEDMSSIPITDKRSWPSLHASVTSTLRVREEIETGGSLGISDCQLMGEGRISGLYVQWKMPSHWNRVGRDRKGHLTSFARFLDLIYALMELYTHTYIQTRQTNNQRYKYSSMQPLPWTLFWGLLVAIAGGSEAWPSWPLLTGRYMRGS